MARKTRPADYATKNIWDECGRCEGKGSVSWGVPVSGVLVNGEGATTLVPQVCFTCRGTGGRYVSQKQLDRREADRARRAVKAEAERERRLAEREAEAAAEAAERAANTAAFAAAHPEVAAALPELGSFGESLAETVASTGTLTDKQLAAAERIAAERAEAPAPAPVVVGRGPVTGKVISHKLHENAYGLTFKMTVQDDRGFRVHGSVPAALDTAEFADGIRVTFTATVTASEDDETFGFYSRPTKASVL